MHEVLKTIGDLGIVPVVTVDDAKDAVPLCRALARGGLPVAEITFRTASAEEAIKRVSGEMPEILVGAGTVLTTQQAERAVVAGARFVVSPGFDSDVVRFCMERRIPITPGCSNPTDIGMATAHGLEVVKFFPAEACGGIKTLKAVSAPFGMLKFVPTGGIDATNLNQYLSFGKVLACGGSWMVKPELIKAGNFEEISRLTREAVAVMLGFDLGHIGINSAGRDDSIAIANTFSELFGIPVEEGDKSNWAGEAFEIVKGKGRGANGHIAIRTNSIPRAVAHLQRKGVAVDMDSAYKPTGDVIASLFLEEEIGGFAVHLLQAK